MTKNMKYPVFNKHVWEKMTSTKRFFLFMFLILEELGCILSVQTQTYDMKHQYRYAYIE